MAEESELQKLKREYTGLKSTAQTWQSTFWSPITDYILPKRGKYSGEGDNQGQAKNKRTKIFDSTAQYAMRTLVAGMQSGMVSPSRPWFRIEVQGEVGLNKYGPVKAWLHEAQSQMYSAFLGSNLYSSMAVTYRELAGFGTAALLQEETFKEHFWFLPQTAGTYCLRVDDIGKVNGFFRSFWLTAENMVKKFGKDNVSNPVKNSADKSPDKQYEIIQCVLPNEKYEADKVDSLSMPWKSRYWEEKGANNDSDSFLQEGGYEEFPAHCPRWEVRDQSTAYGESVGMDVLADVKMLQEIAKSCLAGTHIHVKPPLNIPGTFRGRVSLLPAAQNFIDMGTGQNNVITPTIPQPDLNYPFQMWVATIQKVQEGFFNDLFLMMTQRPGMTATEVVERQEEKLLILGPVIERQMNELLDPIIERSFGILMRKGLLPPIPEELRDRQLNVEYISLLAQAQKLANLGGIERVTNYVGSVAEIQPSALDKLNTDNAIDAYAEAVGTAPDIIRTDDEVKQIREQRAQEAALLQQQEQEAAMTAQAKTLSETDTSGQNALTDLAALEAEGVG